MFTKIEAPILYSKNVAETVRFYTEVLGFSIVENSSDFAIVELGGTKLAFNTEDGRGKRAGYQTIMIKSDAIEVDYSKIGSTGVVFDTPLVDLGYGRTFIFKDRDGNKVEIIE